MRRASPRRRQGVSWISPDNRVNGRTARVVPCWTVSRSSEIRRGASEAGACRPRAEGGDGLGEREATGGDQWRHQRRGRIGQRSVGRGSQRTKRAGEFFRLLSIARGRAAIAVADDEAALV